MAGHNAWISLMEPDQTAFLPFSLLYPLRKNSFLLTNSNEFFPLSVDPISVGIRRPGKEKELIKFVPLWKVMEKQ